MEAKWRRVTDMKVCVNCIFNLVQFTLLKLVHLFGKRLNAFVFASRLRV